MVVGLILPAMPTFVDSTPTVPSYLKTADLNHIAFGLNLCIYRPLAVAAQSTTSTSLSDAVGNAVFTDITFDTIQWDSVGGFGSDGSAYTCQLAGRYQVSGSVVAGPTGSTVNGDVITRIAVNGLAVPGNTVAAVLASVGLSGAIAGCGHTFSQVVPLGLGDRLTIQAASDGGDFSTGLASVVGFTGAVCTVAIFWLGV